jgi:L-histidine N-alpha-methyltransferase
VPLSNGRHPATLVNLFGVSLLPNASFESREHRSLFAEQLGARRTASKFMYSGSGVDLHQRLAREHPEDYEHGRAAQEFSSLVGATTGHLPRQVCDIGTSNGVHTEQFLALYRQAQPEVRMLGLDFSAKMIEIARDRLTTTQTPCSLATWDMEQCASDEIVSWRTNGQMLVCVLGNTLGNVEDPRQVLEHVAHSAEPGDLLLISLYLHNGDDGSATVEYYRWGAIQDLIVEPLRSAGLSELDMRLHLAWVSNAVIGEAELLTPKMVLGVKLAKGERIRCFISRRHDVASVYSLLRSSGWRPMHHDVAGTRGIFLATLR